MKFSKKPVNKQPELPASKSLRTYRDFELERRELQARSTRLVDKMMASLKKALPNTDSEFIGGIVADLDDLWEYGQKLNKHFNILFSMTFPRDEEQLRELILQIKHEQLDESWAHLQRLKKSFPKLLKELERQSNLSLP